MDANVLAETERLLDQLGSSAMIKAGGISQSTGLTWYDLEEKAKMLYPVRTPLRNEIPRVGARGPGQGPQANWKVITAINSPLQLAFVEEGKRGGIISIQTANKSASYKGMGLENPVTFEADYAARAFDDVKEIAMLTALQSSMIFEEQTILHGNTSLQLGTNPTPSVTNSATGGSLAAATYYVYAVTMTYLGQQLCAVGAAPGGTSAPGVTTGVVPTVTRTNADQTTTTMNGGIGKVSAAAGSTTTGGATSLITASCAAVEGAYAYAWFVGTAAGAHNCVLTSITYNNVTTITTLAGAGTQLADGSNTPGWTTTTDYSTNPLAYDGLLTQSMTGGGYYNSLNGGTLTADNAGGIVEWDAALQYFWDTYQASPTQIICSSQQIKDIKKKIIGNGGSGTPIFRINLDNVQGDLGHVVGSARVGSYLNQFAMGDAQELPVRLHPYMPPGKVFFDLQVSPYPNANIGEARAIRTRYDYFAVEWPLVSRSYQYGVYFDSVLQVYIPFLSGIIDGIGNG
jgi:hypothetical protein